MTRAISIPLSALTLMAGCDGGEGSAGQRVGASLQDSAPVDGVDTGPCEIRTEYTTEDIGYLELAQCDEGEVKWLDVFVVFRDSCGRSFYWQGMFYGPEFVVPGTYEVVNGESPLVRAADIPESGTFCFAGTGGTADLTAVDVHERAAGSFVDVTMAQVPCDHKFDPPEDPTTRSRISFSFDGRPKEECPLE